MDALFANQWGAVVRPPLYRIPSLFTDAAGGLGEVGSVTGTSEAAVCEAADLVRPPLYRLPSLFTDVAMDRLGAVGSMECASDQTELIAAVVAFSSTTSLKLCAECEALATRVCGFSGLLSFCLHGSCPCVTTPASAVVRPVLRERACKPALGPDPVGVAAGAVDVKEAPTTGDGRLSSAATEAVSAVSGYDPGVQPADGDISVALASGIHEPQVGEQSIDVERDAVVDHLGAVECVECVDCVAFEEARDVDSAASVHRQGSVTSEEAVCEAADLVQEALPRIVARCDPAPCAATESVFLAGLSAPALLRLRSATLQPATGDSVVPVLPGVREVLHQSLADAELCGALLSDGASDIAAGVGRAVAVDRVSVLSQEAPAKPSVELLAVSTCLVIEVLLMLLAAVAYGVAEARCGDARAVLDSKAVEFIDSGCDPPVTVVLSC